MEGYDGWYDEEQGLDLERRPSSTHEKRQSKIIFESDEAKVRLTEATGDSSSSSSNPNAVDKSEIRRSRVFPGVEVKPRQSRVLLDSNSNNPTNAILPDEPTYVKQNRWPYIIIAFVCFAASVVMIVIGSMCVQVYYDQAVAGEITVESQYCGPTGGGGGIAMIIIGCAGLVLVGYQLWRMRVPMFKLIGTKK